MSEAKRTWATLLLGLLLWGCGASASGSEPTASGGGDESEGDEEVAAPNSVVRKTGGGSVAARLGPPGGALELSEGPRVEVPPGAVEGGQEFVLKVAQRTTAFGNKENEKAVGPTFSFSPGVEAPSGRMITVSLPLPAMPDGWGDPAIAYEVDEGAVSYGEDSTRTKWQYDTVKVTGGRLVAEMPAVAGLRMQFVLSNLEAQ